MLYLHPPVLVGRTDRQTTSISEEPARSLKTCHHHFHAMLHNSVIELHEARPLLT